MSDSNGVPLVAGPVRHGRPPSPPGDTFACTMRTWAAPALRTLMCAQCMQPPPARQRQAAGGGAVAHPPRALPQRTSEDKGQVWTGGRGGQECVQPGLATVEAAHARKAITCLALHPLEL